MRSTPSLDLTIDRTRAQQVGLQQRDVAQNLLISLSGSFQTAPHFWLNPKNGVSYNVMVQTPQYQVDSLQALMNIPVVAPECAGAAGAGQPGDVAAGDDPGGHYALQHRARGGCLCRACRTATWAE